MKRLDAIKQAIAYKINRDELIGERMLYHYTDRMYKDLSKAIGELARDIRSLMECYNFNENDMKEVYDNGNY